MQKAGNPNGFSAFLCCSKLFFAKEEEAGDRSRPPIFVQRKTNAGGYAARFFFSLFYKEKRFTFSEKRAILSAPRFYTRVSMNHAPRRENM